MLAYFTLSLKKNRLQGKSTPNKFVAVASGWAAEISDDLFSLQFCVSAVETASLLWLALAFLYLAFVT